MLLALESSQTSPSKAAQPRDGTFPDPLHRASLRNLLCSAHSYSEECHNRASSAHKPLGEKQMAQHVDIHQAMSLLPPIAIQNQAVITMNEKRERKREEERERERRRKREKIKREHRTQKKTSIGCELKCHRSITPI